jgi:DNA mismatch repair protein MutS2
MLDDIHRLRVEMARERDEAHTARAGAKEAARELRGRLASIEDERQDILRQSRKEAEETLEMLRAEVRQLRGRLRAAAAPVEAVSAVEERLESLEAHLPQAEMLESLAPPDVAQGLDDELQRPIQAGDTVWVRPLNAKGEVLKVDDGEAEVQVGRARTQVSLAALELRREEKPQPVPSGVKRQGAVSTAAVLGPAAPSPGTSIDLRGSTVDETLQRLDLYLDQAMRAGLPQARIIHGKGTGALRQAVRQFLADHPLVSAYEAADSREGGEGVTIARIVKR